MDTDDATLLASETMRLELDRGGVMTAARLAEIADRSGASPAEVLDALWSEATGNALEGRHGDPE